MTTLQPQRKSFFAKYWGLILGGVIAAGIILVAAVVLLYLFVLKGNAKVTDLSLTASSAVYGSEIEASISVENSGLLPMQYQCKVLVDDQEKLLDEVKLEHPQVLKLDLKDLKPGTHKITIGKFEKELKILKPAEFMITDFTVDPSGDVLVGDTVTVTATISNSGEVEGDYTAGFTYDGSPADSKVVSIGPGGEEKIEAKITMAAKGNHGVGLEDKNHTLNVLSPADVSVQDIVLSKAYAKPGEAVTALVSLQNSGDLAGPYKVELLVNGKAAFTQDVTVDPNSQMNLTVNLPKGKAGKYVIQVGDFTQTLYVVTITRPANGTKIVSKVNSGYGKMTISNNNSQDAVIILASTAKPKAPLLMVYVRAKSKVANIKVKDGNYVIFFATGTDWDSSSRRFIKNASYSKFDESAKFKTTRSGGYIYFNNQTITLGSSSGNSPTTNLNDDDFPR